jgi:antitoxin HicB
MKNQFIGSDFDDFLEEQGILEEVEVAAVKKVLAYQIAKEMQKQNISRVEMAKKMETSRAVLNRLLDPENSSVTLRTMAKAAQSVGKRLRLNLE